VFAAISIVKLRNAPIIPDYTMSLESVFTHTAECIIRDSNSLNVLRYCQSGSKLSLPSWVPDWSQPRTASLLKPFRIVSIDITGKYQNYRASIEQKPDFTIESFSRCIFAKGVYVDTITEIEPRAGIQHIIWQQAALRCSIGSYEDDDTDFQSRNVRQGFAVTAEERQMRNSSYRTGSSIAHAFGMTMLTGCIHLTDTFSRNKNSTTWRDRFKEVAGRVSPVVIAEAVYHDHGDELFEAGVGVPGYAESGFKVAWELMTSGTPAALRSQIQSIIPGKSFFVSESKFMGLCTTHAIPGDIIVVLQGMEVPLILREAVDHEYYTVIGEAYVHGVMEDGEAFKDDNADLRTFEIR